MDDNVKAGFPIGMLEEILTHAGFSSLKFNSLILLLRINISLVEKIYTFSSLLHKCECNLSLVRNQSYSICPKEKLGLSKIIVI